MSHMNYNIQCYEGGDDAGDDNTDTDNNASDACRHSANKETISDFIDDVTAKIQNNSHLQSEDSSVDEGETVDTKDKTESDNVETDSLLPKLSSLGNQDKEELEVDNNHSEFPQADEPLLKETEKYDSNCWIKILLCHR